MSLRILISRLIVATLVTGFTSCAVNPVSGNSNFVTMSESQEIGIGRSEDAKVRKQYGVYEHPALQQAVGAIGQRLARASHRPSLLFHFLVVDSPEVNAFALPGGYVYITRGILAYLNSEAELAAVLGHEIGHVTARHSVQQLSATTAANVGASLLQIFVPQIRNSAGDLLVNVLGSALLSGYGREHELEADRLGAEYLARTGYDPQAMIRVVGVLKNQELFDAEVARAEGREPRKYHGLFASHPDNDTRLQEIVREAGKVRAAGDLVNREQFMRLSDRMIFGDSPEQGIVRNHTFYHAPLGFTLPFPAGWKVRNSPASVTATAPDNTALMDLRGAGSPQATPAATLRRFLKLGAGSEATPITISGLPAATIDLNLSGKPTRVAAIHLGKAAYVIGLQGNDRNGFNKQLPLMMQSLRGFHAITESERALARPLRIRVITAGADDTFRKLASRSPLGQFAEGHLRLLNGRYPAGEPVSGEALKIVE